MNASTDVIERIAARAEERLIRLCEISSESGNASGIGRVAEMLARDLERHGLRVDVVLEADAHGKQQPMLLARGPAAGPSHLLLLGHLDTVLPAIEPSLQGRRLFATGSYDMKGGLAMFAGALDLLAERGQKYPDDLLLVLVPDEESESAISGEATKRWSEGARAVLVLEPGQARGDGETLVAGRRGLTEWILRGTGRASHSGVAYWVGRSAAAAVAEWCAAAQKLSTRGHGPTVNVARILAGSGDFVENFAERHELIGTSRQLNVVSDRAMAEGEIRYLTMDDRPKTIDALAEMARRIASEHEVELRFEEGMSVPPVDPDGPGAPLIRRVVELAAARGFRLQLEEDRGGISFPNFIADPATTPVIDGLGPAGDGMHVRGEYLDLDSLQRRIVLLADLLSTL